MTRCKQAWMPAVVAAMLFASGCPVSGTSGDGGPVDAGDGGHVADAGDRDPDAGDLGAIVDASSVCLVPDASDYPIVGGGCCDEGLFYCWTPTYQCCHGVWIEYNDGPCGGPVPDPGPPDCATYPTTRGCPCIAGEPIACDFFRPWLECVSGVWTANASHACCF